MTQPPDSITGRDVELVVVGVLCVFAAGVWGVRPDGSLDPSPLVVFALLATVSFLLALWDVRTRSDASTGRDEGR